MTERVYLKQMVVGRNAMSWCTWEDQIVSAPIDKNLGQIMAAVSSMAKALAGLPSETRALVSDTVLDEFRIEPLTVEPFAFRLVMASGPHRFTCHLDRDLEHILLGFSAAMKFFALKCGLVIVDPEVTRNAEFAREHGLYTPPEGTA